MSAQLCIDSLESYLPMVRRIAATIASSIPVRVRACGLDVDDLYQAGVVGLCQSRQRYDPARMQNFSTYAYYRVRGAMLDELRKQEWLPRGEVARLQKEGRTLRRIITRQESLQYAASPVPTRDGYVWDAAWRLLTKDQKKLVTLYYEEGLTMRQIAQLWGFHPSWITELHQQIIEHLRWHLLPGYAAAARE